MTNCASSDCSSQWSLRLVVCVTALLLSACRTELYTRQTESDVNTMLATLVEQGVPADKQSGDGGKTWNLLVDESQVAQAMRVLQAAGLPHQRHATLGEIFRKDGLVSTPTEERVRFIHGVSQELSATLSAIDGVVVAKVHIVLPDNDPLATTVRPSSASVFVKHRPEADLSALAPSIKNLVARSVEGLSYERVTLTMVPGLPVQNAPERRAEPLWAWLAAALAGLSLLAASAWWVLQQTPLKAWWAARHPGPQSGTP